MQVKRGFAQPPFCRPSAVQQGGGEVGQGDALRVKRGFGGEARHRQPALVQGGGRGVVDLHRHLLAGQGGGGGRGCGGSGRQGDGLRGTGHGHRKLGGRGAESKAGKVQPFGTELNPAQHGQRGRGKRRKGDIHPQARLTDKCPCGQYRRGQRARKMGHPAQGLVLPTPLGGECAGQGKGGIRRHAERPMRLVAATVQRVQGQGMLPPVAVQGQPQVGQWRRGGRQHQLGDF